ncbi:MULTISPECIES: sugar phosphate isomerase/epimerase [unclassified Paenibacillus]|uniref:sugar phosphate isomerase/epimerase family protein n=1 Tax=unclassified Paenibacillus TaxID=185978 RepID=UPI00277E2DA6|nr:MULTISPECIES: sugar phosphate isomerase/epimerase [unclassified Paenibacillus]MDQ0900491.1 sugar phosphate isomerase/epimerase [Paenibacillus sp. V4I7]MDQ0920999.1 sugar phosphate isomerase/epimerase [Paenibacillus sp. V4I5]
MNKKLRVGTLVGGGDAVRIIPQIAKHGFESYSLSFWQTTGNIDLKETAKRVADIVAEHDAVISTIGVFGNPLTGTGDNKDTLASWERLIDHAHLFGTDIVNGFTGRIPDRPIDESIPKFKEVFGELSRRAADHGVRLAFENCDMGGTWKTGDWNIAHNPTAWNLMFNAVPADNIGLEWEPCHQMVSLIDPIPQLRKWVDKVFHVHGKDATIAWDIVREYGVHGSQEFVWHRTPGFGDTNWSDIITILRQAGYQGTIDIEGWHDPVYRDELEMTGQVHALNYLKRCRGGDYIPNPV